MCKCALRISTVLENTAVGLLCAWLTWRRRKWQLVLHWRTAPCCGKSFLRTFVHEIKAVVLHDSNSSQRIFTALCDKEADEPAPPVRIFPPMSSRTRDWGSTCRFLNHQLLLPVSEQLLLLFGLGLPPHAADLVPVVIHSNHSTIWATLHSNGITHISTLRHNRSLHLCNTKREKLLTTGFKASAPVLAPQAALKITEGRSWTADWSCRQRLKLLGEYCAFKTFSS